MRKKIGSDNGVDISIDTSKITVRDAWEAFTSAERDMTYDILGKIVQRNIDINKLDMFLVQVLLSGEYAPRFLNMSDTKQKVFLFMATQVSKKVDSNADT